MLIRIRRTESASNQSSRTSLRDRLNGWLIPDRRDVPELLDQSGHLPTDLAVNLRDIRRFNRLGGGYAPIMRHLPALLDRVPPNRAATILDLGTGSADIPLLIARWARRRQKPVHIIASDISADILAIATANIATEPSISVARYDALDVPLADASVDVVLCSLTLHHFPPESAVALLREMDRLANHGFIVNDLSRNRLSFAAAWLSTRVATRNQLTRHDAPRSVLRAYVPTELEELISRAGVHDAIVHRHPWWRMAAVKGRGPKVLETASGQ